MTKDSLIRGTIILAGAAFVARFLGLVQKVPLQHILGDGGMATYGIAYTVYGMLLIVATAGIPSALSKMIAERYEMGQLAEAKWVYQAAVWFALIGGVVGTVFLYTAAPLYAVHIAKNPDAALAIRAIAPALLIFPLIAIMRGYFQGRRAMKAGALSQIFEQIVRVTTAVGIAVLFLWWGYAEKTIAAGASFGAVTGAASAFLVMVYFQRKQRHLDRIEGLTTSHTPTDRTDWRYRDIYRAMLKLSLPISIISLTVPMIYVIDASTVIGLLQERLGVEEATNQLGILTGKAQSLAGIPPILAIALSMSIVPIISAAYAKQDRAELEDKASLTLRISLISGLPVVIVLAVASEAVIGFLFSDAVGWEVASLLTASALFQIVMMTSGAILMGLGKTSVPMLYVIVGVIVKLLGNMLLAPAFGMYGILGATLLCFIFIVLLNLYHLRGIVAYRVLGHRWPGFVLTGAVLVMVGIGLVLLFDWISISGKLGYGLEAAVIGSILMLIYPICLFLFKAILAEDVQRFPSSLQKLLKPFERWLVKR